MTATMTPPAWERRYRVPSLFLPDWSPDAPDRIVGVGNEPRVILDLLAAYVAGIAAQKGGS